ncbi:MAG: hypothetical protein ACTSPV_19825 [Candidatus Hodarchaeales archaeon]
MNHKSDYEVQKPHNRPEVLSEPQTPSKAIDSMTNEPYTLKKYKLPEKTKEKQWTQADYLKSSLYLFIGIFLIWIILLVLYGEQLQLMVQINNLVPVMLFFGLGFFLLLGGCVSWVLLRNEEKKE